MNLSTFADELEKVAFFGFGMSPELKAQNDRARLLNLPHNINAFNTRLEHAAKKMYKKPLKDLDDAEWSGAFSYVDKQFTPTSAPR